MRGRRVEQVIVAILFALPLLVLRANVRAPENLNFLDRALLRVSAPIQSLLTGGVRKLQDGWEHYVAVWRVGEDNQRLRAENVRLRQDLARLGEQAAKADELERALALRRRVAVDTVAARVVAAETSPLFRVQRLKLDRGELEVKKGMPVLAADGVVGRIQRVFGSWADVLLLTDPQSAIDVVIRRNGARGVVHGLPGSDRYRMRIQALSRKDDVVVGDEVMTSGLVDFPASRPVGRVVSVTRKDGVFFQEAEIEPAVDLGKLRDVLVVITPPAPDSAEKAEK